MCTICSSCVIDVRIHFSAKVFSFYFLKLFVLFQYKNPSLWNILSHLITLRSTLCSPPTSCSLSSLKWNCTQHVSIWRRSHNFPNSHLRTKTASHSVFWHYLPRHRCLLSKWLVWNITCYDVSQRALCVLSAIRHFLKGDCKEQGIYI
jgi:hypothetical protein